MNTEFSTPKPKLRFLFLPIHEGQCTSDIRKHQLGSALLIVSAPLRSKKIASGLPCAIEMYVQCANLCSILLLLLFCLQCSRCIRNMTYEGVTWAY